MKKFVIFLISAMLTTPYNFAQCFEIYNPENELIYENPYPAGLPEGVFLTYQNVCPKWAVEKEQIIGAQHIGHSGRGSHTLQRCGG